MNRLIAVLLFTGALATAGPFTAADGLLNPTSGALVGLPGQTVIWGIDLRNPTNDWWVITSVQSDYTFTGAPGEIPAGPDFFTDYLSVAFLDEFVLQGVGLQPRSGIFQGGSQDPQLGTPGVDGLGLASFAISPTALPGTDSAQIHIFYDIYDGNPFSQTNPGNYLGSDQLDLNTSVTVAPEPGTGAMLALALGLFAVVRWRRKHRAANLPA